MADSFIRRRAPCATARTARAAATAAIALTSALNVGSIVNTMTNGRNEMPAFGAVMSQDELRDVAAYLLEDLLRE